MKRKFAVIAIICVLLLSGCGNEVVDKAVEETKEAILNGDFEAALNYGEMALKEGCDDDEFILLVDNLENYLDAGEALENDDLDKAKEIFEKIDDFDGSGMGKALGELEKSIDEAVKKNEEYIENRIEEIRGKISKGYYYTASNEAESLLEKDLSDSHRKIAEDLKRQAEAGKAKEKNGGDKIDYEGVNPTAPTSGLLSKQQAIDIAKAAVNPSSDAKITVTRNENVYIVNFETVHFDENGTFTDGVSCMVDVYSGEVVGLAG